MSQRAQVVRTAIPQVDPERRTLSLIESSRQVWAEGKLTLRNDPSYPHFTTSGRFGRPGIAFDMTLDVIPSRFSYVFFLNVFDPVDRKMIVGRASLTS